MKKFDCHTHLQTQELIDEYFSMYDVDYAIAIEALNRAGAIGYNVDFWNLFKNKNHNVVQLACIDVEKDIAKQLKEIAKRIKDGYRIVGLKIYLGYQSIFADDPKLFAVYDFAAQNNLSVCYHCGMVAGGDFD